MSPSWNYCNPRKKPDPPEMMNGIFLDTTFATSPSRKKPDPPEMVVCSALDPMNPNKCSFPDELFDAEEVVNRGENIIGMTFLRKLHVDGVTYRHRAEVKKRLETPDGDTEQYLVSLGDGKREEVMTYSALLDILEKQQHAEQVADPDGYCTFKSIAAHRKNGRSWDVLIKWEDDSETWEPLSSISRQDPITLAAYAKNHSLSETHGWKRFKSYVKTSPKLVSGARRSPSPAQGVAKALSIRFPLDFSDRPGTQRYIDTASSQSPAPIMPVVRESQTSALTLSPDVCSSMQQGAANSVCGNGRDRATVPCDMRTLPESEEYRHGSLLGDDEFGISVPPHYPDNFPATNNHASQLPICASQHPQPAGVVGKKGKAGAKSYKSGWKRPSKGPSGNTLGAAWKKATNPLSRSSKKKLKMATSSSSEPVNQQKSAAATAVSNTASGGKKGRATTQGITMLRSGKWVSFTNLPLGMTICFYHCSFLIALLVLSTLQQAQLYYAGKTQYIGMFDTRERAALAFETAREKLNSDKLSSGVLDLKATESAVKSARLAAYDVLNKKYP